MITEFGVYLQLTLYALTGGGGEGLNAETLPEIDDDAPAIVRADLSSVVLADEQGNREESGGRVGKTNEEDEIESEGRDEGGDGDVGRDSVYGGGSSGSDGSNVGINDIDPSPSDDNSVDIGEASELEATQATVSASQTFEVTWYTAGVESTGKSPGDVGYGVTASGEYVQEGVTIACPPSMAFGTVVHIEGVGERVCHDRGSAITEGRIDVYTADLQQARKNGRQSLEVTIY